jgi:hypothetical protein
LKTFIIVLLFNLFASCFPAFSREPAISFEYFQRVIFLNVSVNETDHLLFLFDTGTPVSVIDEETVYKLDLPFVRTDVVERNGGLKTVAMVQAHEMRVGNVTVKNMDLAVEDLRYTLAPANRQIDGILGTDFMKSFIVGIDFVKQKISFSTKLKSASGFIPFEMDNNIPKIKVTINDTIHTFLRYDSGSSLFDTDNSFGNASTEDWIALQLVDSTFRQVNYFTGARAIGSVRLTAVPVRTFFFIGDKVKYPFIFVQPRQGYFARPEAIGFFGNNLFEKFERVQIDFPANRIYLSGKE